MAIRILFGAAALALTSTASFAAPAHSPTQLGERHVNYAAAQWTDSQAASPSVQNDGSTANGQDQACPTQCK